RIGPGQECCRITKRRNYVGTSGPGIDCVFVKSARRRVWHRAVAGAFAVLKVRTDGNRNACGRCDYGPDTINNIRAVITVFVVVYAGESVGISIVNRRIKPATTAIGKVARDTGAG